MSQRRNGERVTLPDGRTGRWFRVGREQPYALWPSWEAWPYVPKVGDCGWMVPMRPRLDQIEARGVRWANKKTGGRE